MNNELTFGLTALTAEDPQQPTLLRKTGSDMLVHPKGLKGNKVNETQNLIEPTNNNK